jgi:DNA-binding HxlR family transcriptional regulator
MAAGYRQFCPVAKAMELLDERWTMLVVRELVVGSERFNDLRRGVPTMSPTLLSKRLQQLVRAGVVERQEVGQEVRYRLTPAGRELAPVVEMLGAWGVRWMGELGDEDLDPKLLLWDVHRRIDLDRVPQGRTVVEFCFPDVNPRARHWWLVIDRAGADVCDVDPGHPVALLVTSPLRTLVEVWRGDRRWTDAVSSGDVVVEGPTSLRRALPEWLLLSSFATVPRPA